MFGDSQERLTGDARKLKTRKTDAAAPNGPKALGSSSSLFRSASTYDCTDVPVSLPLSPLSLSRTAHAHA